MVARGVIAVIACVVVALVGTLHAQVSGSTSSCTTSSGGSESQVGALGLDYDLSAGRMPRAVVPGLAVVGVVRSIDAYTYDNPVCPQKSRGDSLAERCRSVQVNRGVAASHGVVWSVRGDTFTVSASAPASLLPTYDNHVPLCSTMNKSAGLTRMANQRTELLSSPVATGVATNTARAAEDAAGIVYRRTDLMGGKPYIGQAKSEARYVARQAEHARAHPDADFEFEIIGRAKPGTQLDRMEEFYIREGGGPINLSNPNGGLANMRHQMSDPRYLAAGGGLW